MRYGILFLSCHLGERSFVALRTKHRVISKAGLSMLLSGDSATALSFKDSNLPVNYKGNVGYETRIAVFFAFKIGKQQLHVAYAVMSFGRCVTRGMHSRRAAESIYLKPGVIGKTIHSIFFRHIARFHKSIAAYGVSCLGYLFMASYFIKRFYNESVTCDFSYFLQFMLVVGSKYEYTLLRFCHKSITINISIYYI